MWSAELINGVWWATAAGEPIHEYDSEADALERVELRRKCIGIRVVHFYKIIKAPLAYMVNAFGLSRPKERSSILRGVQRIG